MDFFGAMDQGVANISVELPNGTDLDTTEETALEVLYRLQDIPEVDMIYASVGTSQMSAGTNSASITVNLVEKDDRDRSTDEVCEEILISARERGTGIARRTPEYISEKILAGKAVIALTEDGRFAGFSYIETWGGKEYVANSGLIVAHGFRGIGLAMRIKTRIFQLSRELFPNAKKFFLNMK